MINVLLNYYNFDGDWAYNSLKEYINSNCKVVILPLAFRDSQAWDNNSWQALYGKEGEKYNNIVTPFSRYGIMDSDIEWINYFTDCTESALQKINNADIILLTGGLPEKIIQHLNDMKLADAIKNFNGVLLGVSAGAMVQLDNYHITPDDDYCEYIAKNCGLGLIKGFDLEVHYEQTAIQIECARQAVKDNGLPVVAIYHEGGIMSIQDNCGIVTFGKTKIYTQNDLL